MKKEEVLNGLDVILKEGGIRAKRDPKGKSQGHLRWMIKEMKTKEFPDTKWNRWVGYIQGVMVIYNLTFLDTERDRNR